MKVAAFSVLSLRDQAKQKHPVDAFSEGAIPITIGRRMEEWATW